MLCCSELCKSAGKNPEADGVDGVMKEEIGAPNSDSIKEILYFSLFCTVFILNTPASTISDKMREKSYTKLKEEVDDYINQMQKPGHEFDFKMVRDSDILILAMLNKDDTNLLERLNDCKLRLKSISFILNGPLPILEEFSDFSTLIEDSYHNQNHYDAFNYFMCYSSACYQEWFKDKTEQASTAYRLVLLARVVVRMVELTGINATIKYEVSLPKNHMFSYFSLMGICVLENNWKDKVECITLKNPDISAIIGEYRDEFFKRIMRTAAGSSGETKAITEDKMGKAKISSDGQLDTLSEYLKVLLEMLLCTSMSEEKRLDILAENVGSLSGVRDYYKKRFPEEYEEAFEKCLAIAKEMEQAYSRKGVWETGKILEQ
ncbi:hypothetical protein Ciccas_013230, partial [Cichlidogyrus casuarinus]